MRACKPLFCTKSPQRVLARPRHPARLWATSWAGINDNSSLDKDIKAIVHVVYEVGEGSERIDFGVSLAHLWFLDSACAKVGS